MSDDIRPRGTVQLECIKCEWSFWVDPMHPMLDTGECICPSCAAAIHGTELAKETDR